MPHENILKYNQLATAASIGQEKINDLHLRTNLPCISHCFVLCVGLTVPGALQKILEGIKREPLSPDATRDEWLARLKTWLGAES